MEDERTEAPEYGDQDQADANGNDEKGDDAEGQALTWKVRRPIQEAAEEDVEGQSMRPSPDAAHGLPSSKEREVD